MARGNYWTSSKIVQWIRKVYGPGKPTSATPKNWKIWRLEYQKNQPKLYWLTEKLPTILQNFIMAPADKIDSIYYALNSRFKDRYYAISSDLDKSQYHEIDTRMLHCNFQALVDFVEIEQAISSTYSWDDKEEHKRLNKLYGIKWYHKNRWIALFAPRWRSREAGLKHFEWECNLIVDESWCGYQEGTMTDEDKAKYPDFGQLTSQAKKAREILELYKWWTEVRPNRPDSMEASGYNKFYERYTDDDDVLSFLESKSKEEDEEKSKVCNAMWEIDRQYSEEDDAMLIKLIEMRKSLWT